MCSCICISVCLVQNCELLFRIEIKRDFVLFIFERYELERRQAEAKRRLLTEDEKRKAKELEEQRRRELAKPKQREDRML